MSKKPAHANTGHLMCISIGTMIFMPHLFLAVASFALVFLYKNDVLRQPGTVLHADLKRFPMKKP
jgi:hypothetical protein